MWTPQVSAIGALREIVAEAGLQPEEYALHSVRVGGTTHLSAPEALRGDDRGAF